MNINETRTYSIDGLTSDELLDLGYLMKVAEKFGLSMPTGMSGHQHILMVKITKEILTLAQDGSLRRNIEYTD